jgi:hypothetical protein
MTKGTDKTAAPATDTAPRATVATKLDRLSGELLQAVELHQGGAITDKPVKDAGEVEVRPRKGLTYKGRPAAALELLSYRFPGCSFKWLAGGRG